VLDFNILGIFRTDFYRLCRILGLTSQFPLCVSPLLFEIKLLL